MALPAGTTIPPIPYAIALLVAVVAVGWFLVWQRPAVTERTVLALAPWMAAGAGLHALYQLPVDLGPLAPLLGTPAVYLTTFVLAGSTWAVLATRRPDSTWGLGGTGGFAFLVVATLVLTNGERLQLGWPILIVVGAIVLSAAVFAGIRRYRQSVLEPAPALAWLVVFAHALDGVSTAVGHDVFDFYERTPLSRVILDIGGALPTADVVGAGWLFVLVKLAVAAAVIGLFAEYVRERPERGYLLLGFVAAVGLGPGTQNVLLFAITVI